MTLWQGIQSIHSQKKYSHKNLRLENIVDIGKLKIPSRTVFIKTVLADCFYKHLENYLNPVASHSVSMRTPEKDVTMGGRHRAVLLASNVDTDIIGSRGSGRARALRAAGGECRMLSHTILQRKMLILNSLK